MAGKAGNKALVKVSGAAVAFSSEATTSADTLTYQLSSTSLQGVPWHPSNTITVNATSGAAGDAYSVYRLNGTVVFATSATRTITISCDYLPMSQAAEAHEYSYTCSADNLLDAAFDDTYQSRIQGLKDVTGSVTLHWVDRTYSNILTSSSEFLVFEFYSQSTGTYEARAWGILNTLEVETPIEDLIGETVGFEGLGDNERNVITFTTAA